MKVERGVYPAGSPADADRADADRVWVTIERKCRVAQYESLTVNLGAAVSVLPGESLEEAHRRAFAATKPEFDEVLELMRKEAGI